MSKSLEIEFKSLLTEGEYDHILAQCFAHATPIIQRNIYIDTDAFELRQSRMMLRIRVTDHACEMTLKRPAVVGLTEINVPLDSERFDTLPSAIASELDGVDVEALSVQGELHNIRFETDIDGGTLVLDKSSYENNVDFELEFEVDDYDKGRVSFNELLKRFGIEKKSDIPKAERFYRAMKKEL